MRRPTVRAIVDARSVYRNAQGDLARLIEAALRPGDIITYTQGSRCCNARVMADPDKPKAAHLSSGYPEIMRVKVASLYPGSKSEYWLHVRRIMELDP